jgi:HEAT repeat protein
MRRVFLTATACLLLLLPATASGQMTGNVEKLKADLYGDNLNRAVAAASALGTLKSKEALETLLAGLQLGTPPALTLALLEAVETHNNPTSIPVLEVYITHRRQEIRRAAIKALGTIQDKKAVPPLIQALSDSNPMVRAQAARLLGERKERSAERPLFMMLRRGDNSAAEPLGIVGGVQTAMNLGELMGELPDKALARALGTMLKRKDFGPDTLRTEIIKALSRMPCEAVKGPLADYVASISPNELRMSKNVAKIKLEECQK